MNLRNVNALWAICSQVWRQSRLSAAGASAMLLMLSACGGGGGSSSVPTANLTPTLASSTPPKNTSQDTTQSTTPPPSSNSGPPSQPYVPPPAVTPQQTETNQDPIPENNPPPPAPTDPLPTGKPASEIGQWSPVYPWPQVAINLALLPSGKVLSYADDDNADYHRTGIRSAGFSKAYVVDIPTDSAPGNVTYVPNNRTDLFCSGHAYLSDGRLLVVGGHRGVDGVGSWDTNLFDYRDLSWNAGAPMNAGRWYPSATTLPNGEVLTLGGLMDPQTVNSLPQVWKNTPDGGWRDLTSAKADGVGGYPPMHVAPNGKVVLSILNGTKYLDTSGTGSWSDVVAWHNFNGYRDYAPSVIYGDGKVLVMGGSDPPTNTAEVIDLNAADPKWEWTGTMRFKRRHHNATILADGQILVTGGTASPGFNDATDAVLAAEMWNPANGVWTTMASMKVARAYHSTALLLPDGRVLSAGGGRPAPVNGVDNLNAEIYSPPYLFKGTRPQITGAPAAIHYGDTFVVQTPDQDIVKATWIKLSSVTHTFNMDQRINYLKVGPPPAGVQNAISVTGPTDRNLTPPGHYMLFLINSKGVPSVAKIIQIT